RIKLLCQEMERNAKLPKRVQQDNIVEFIVTVQVDTAITLNEVHSVALLKTKIFLSRSNDTRVELHHVNLSIRHCASEISRYRPCAQPNHQNALDGRRISEGHWHHPVVPHGHVVGVFEINDRFQVVRTSPVPAAEAKKWPMLVDEEVVVLGFDM